MTQSAPLNLDLDILNVRAPILPSRAPTAALGRNLTEGDRKVLAAAKIGPGQAPLKKIRMVHHQAARLLAQGLKNIEVALATGFTPEHIYNLKNSPAFEELVEFYAAQDQQIQLDVRARMLTLGLDAAAEMQERLLDDPEQFSNKDLNGLITMALPFGGQAPATKDAGASRGASKLSKEELAEIKSAVKEGGRSHALQKNPTVVDGELVPDRAIREKDAE